jgi:hypothetical protein
LTLHSPVRTPLDSSKNGTYPPKSFLELVEIRQTIVLESLGF